METTRLKRRRIMAAILSIVMVLSTIHIGPGFVFAQNDRYIFEYDGETASSALNGFSLTAKQMGKTNALKFGSNATDITLWKDSAISTGTAVFEIEMLPAGSCNEIVRIYNSAGEQLLEITNFITKYKVTSGDGKTSVKDIAAPSVNSGSNLWTRLRVEFYFDNVVTDEDGNRVFQYKISVSESPKANAYSEVYEGWLDCGSITQQGVVGKGYANGIANQNIDGSAEHPFDIAQITVQGTAKNRWIGDVRLYCIESVNLFSAPGVQLAGTEFSAGDTTLAVNYSTGATDYVRLADLTQGTDYTIEGYDSSAAVAEQAITIGYMGNEVPATVEIKEIDHIQVTAPSQTYVEKNAELDVSDMEVTAVFSDGSTAELGSADYTLSLDTASTGKKTARVAFNGNSALYDEFEVIVTIPEYTGSINTILDYGSDITDISQLGMTLSEGASLSVSDAAENIAGNATQKLKLASGSMTKDWGYDITSGVVKLGVELNRNSKNAFYRVLDKDGNSLISVGQFSNTNLYDGASTVDATTEDYFTLVSGSSDNWLRLETTIDLDASDSMGSLQFITKVYTKADYTDAWEYRATVTPESYTDDVASNHANGCATEGLTSFSVGSVEYSTRTANTDGAYFDNLYIGATQAITLTGVSVKTAPAKTEYVPGVTKLELYGLELTETYSDFSTKDVSDPDAILAAYDITGFDTSSAGNKTITVASKSDSAVTTSFDITVKDVSLVSIAVKTSPDKTDYLVGSKSLDLTGLVIEGTYSDNSVAELNTTEYAVSTPDFGTAGSRTVTVTANAKDADGNDVTASFEITVISVKDIFAYSGEAETAEELLLKLSSGAALALDTATAVAGHTSQKLKLAAGSMTKTWGYDITSGVVRLEAELNRNGKSAFFTVRDKDGNALITIGQFSNTNIYGALDSAYTTSGLPYVTLVSGSKEAWIRLETEIDLDASNAAGVLQFAVKIYTKAAYTDDWTYKATLTAETYQSTTFGNANGCATAGLTSFSVGSAEYATQASNTAGAYFDKLYVGATNALSAVEVKTLPAKTEYVAGAGTLDLTGLVLTETYGTGTSHADDLSVIEENYTFTGFDTSSAGVKTITVTNKNNPSVKTSFDITIKDAALASISIKTLPDKTEYYIGDTEADTTGMVVEAVYGDASTAYLAVTDYTVGELVATAAGKTKIRITAAAKNAAGEDVWTEYEVTIKTPVVTGIKVTALPVKTQYLVGDAADWSGLVVKALYDNGSAKEIDMAELTISGFDSGAVADSRTISVEYGGFTAAFTIKVIDAASFTATEYNFDFNIEGSNTADGWTGIFVNKKGGSKYGVADYGYSAENGYGLNTTVATLQGRNENPLANPAYSCIPKDAYKDYVLFGAAKGSFDVDLPNGTYNVQIIVGTTSANTTTIKIEDNDAYTGTVTVGSSDTKMFNVIDIPNVVVSDGQMNIAATADSNARTSAIIISNISAPAGLSADLDTSAENEVAVALSWNVSLGCTGYNIYRTAGGAAELVATVDGMATTAYRDTAVDCLETYTYFVRGISAKGLETMASNEAEVTVKDESVAAPEVPANFKISSMNAEATTLTWSAADNARYYVIYQIDKSAPDTDSLSGYTMAGKTAATTYVCNMDGHSDMYFKIVAVGLGGKSAATDIAFSDAAAPLTPANLKVNEVTADKTVLAWDASENAVYYEVYWSDRNRADLSGTEGYRLIGKANTNSFVYELPTHVVRYFKVVAVGSGGRSEATECVKADIVKEFNVQAEWLDRGLIAIEAEGGVYVAWRLMGDEYAAGAGYKLYRDGEVIRTFSQTENTSFFDTDGTAESKYAVSSVIDGAEGEKCAEAAVQSTDYLEVPLQIPESYYDDKLTTDHIKSKYYGDSAFISENIVSDEEKAAGTYTYAVNDTYVGDVDGDGVYELIVKWSGMTRDNSQSGYTSPVYIDCYKLDGTLLWRINLGINIRAGAHYTQPVVADLDGDGKAEIMMRTADGTVDGKGTVIGEAAADYRNSSGHIITGTDYLTLFDGETGAALDTITYIPQRGSASAWGDNYGGRSERFLSGAAYLDGEHISAVFARGYYTRAVVVAYDVVDNRIVTRWVCDSDDSENASLYGQGAHSFTVADADGDGCQEIIYGAATIDHDGKLMYSESDYGSGYGGHGDALRVTDMNLTNPGLEVFMVHEEYPNNASVEMHDAATGEFIYTVGTSNQDVGRGAAGDIDPRYEGVETWSTVKDSGSETLAGLRDAEGNIIAKRPSPVNHMAWFNGDMGREFVDNTGSVPYIGTWDYENSKIVTTLLTGCRTNNTTKANPCFQADMFGDWREELAFRTEDNAAIRIYTSAEVMDYRLYTLMHDPTYRAQMACNGSAYNQSPDAGFYIGYDTDLMIVPVPTLDVVKAVSNESVEVVAIEVTSPDKLTYIVGEELDLSGMIVTAVYNNKTTKVLTEGYTVDTSAFDSGRAGESQTITVNYGAFSDSFNVKIINQEDSQSFYYIDADSVEDLNITVSEGGALNIVEDSKNGNDTNKLEIVSGTITRKLDETITSGKVTIEHSGYQNGKVLSWRILDGDGNGLISTAQQASGNLNLYENVSTTGSPFQTLCNTKNKWVKTVTVIDLDKSNEKGVLQFTVTVYYKSSYDAVEWTQAGVFTQDSTYASAASFGHANGAATDSLTSFGIGAIEFQSNGTSYVDDIFFDDGSGIHGIVTSEKKLKSIEITKPATLTEYMVGSELNTAGLEITGTYEVTYSDGRTPVTKKAVVTRYETSYDFSQVTDNAVVTITVKDGEDRFTQTYSVKVIPKADGSYVTFEYVDDESAALIGFSGSNLSVTNGEISAEDITNLTNRITVAKGTATKVFDAPFTSGSVHFETAFMTMATSKASLFLRIKNSEGKPMLDIAQYGSSNLNMYIDEKTSGTDGAMAGKFAGLPVKKWAKFEVDIDLDATRTKGHLVFDAVVWVTDDYADGNWTRFAEFDETLYLNSETAPTTTGSASSTATVLDIASIELYNAAGSLNYYDDMYFEAMGEGVSKKLSKLEITQEATKKIYTEGDSFNASGLEVMGTWQYTFKDGTTGTRQRQVTNYDVEFNGMVTGESVPVVISVGKLSVSYNVRVKPNGALDGIEAYIVDYVNNDLVTLSEDGTISINKKQIRLPYSNAAGVRLDYSAETSNVTVNNRIMTVKPSTRKVTEAVITVSVVVKNSDGKDITIRREVSFKVAKASSSGGNQSISFEPLTDYEEAVNAMIEQGLFEDQERLNSAASILSQLDGDITIEEFVAILVNLFEVDKTYTETKIDRDDIDYNAWYADYVIAAFQLSLETEESRTGGESFGIGDSLTKEDIIYMLSRIVAVDKTTLPSDYATKMFE